MKKIILSSLSVILFSNSFADELLSNYQKGLNTVYLAFEDYLSNKRKEKSLPQDYDSIEEYDLIISNINKSVSTYTFTPQLREDHLVRGGGVVYTYDFKQDKIVNLMFTK